MWHDEFVLFPICQQTQNALRFLGLNHQVGLDFIA
jgi:hypothetical protein